MNVVSILKFTSSPMGGAISMKSLIPIEHNGLILLFYLFLDFDLD